VVDNNDEHSHKRLNRGSQGWLKRKLYYNNQTNRYHLPKRGGALPRRIVTESLARTLGAGAEPDDYKTRLLKYVPAETNTLYVTIMGAVITAQNELPAENVAEIPFSIIRVLIFIGCFLFNLVYMWRVAKETSLARLGISAGAFVVWAIALGDVFAGVSWWYTFYGTIILGFYTALAAVYLGK